MATTSAILFSLDDRTPPETVERWLTDLAVPVLRISDAEMLMSVALRSRPRVVVFDARVRPNEVLDRAPPGEDRLVHGRCARRRRNRPTTPPRSTPASGWRRRGHSRTSSGGRKRAFVSTPCCVARTAICTSIRRRGYPARSRSRRRSRGDWRSGVAVRHLLRRSRSFQGIQRSLLVL